MKLKLLLLTLLFSALSWGQVSITGLGVGNTYSQNFNTASASVPAGWYFYETGSNANTAFSSGTGTGTGGDTYFLGNSNEWAFGGLQSGSLNPTVGAAFTNNTGSNITEFVISYVGETWRIGSANRSDRLDFQYSDNATSLSTGTWIDDNTLDYENLGQAKGSGSMRHSATITSTITGLNIAPGATFWIRWTDFNASGADDAMAVDSFSIYANGGPATLADIVLHSNNPAVAASTITQAENNHVIYAFDLAVSSANATLNNVVFNTTGSYAASNITNFKLWYSTDATFDSATDTMLNNLTSSLGTGSHTFTGFTRAINTGTTGYFFITTDIPCAATVANDLTVSAITTADLTFVSGNKSGTAFASGTHTIVGATPNNVTALATSTCENGAATVSWTLPTGCYDNILVFVSDTPFTTAVPSGNGGAYAESSNFTSGTPFDGGYAAYKGTGTSVTISGLTNGTTYYYKVFTRNGLLWSNGVTVSCTPTMAYCASGATSSLDSEIENVVLTGVNNSISNNTANVCTTGVNDYTAMSADLEVGGSYTLTVEFGDCNGGSQYDGAGGVWIDWNNDGDFDDANETIGTATILMTASDTNVIQNFTINVPIAQPVGFYRMRIVQKEAGSAGSISPCGTFSYGSTEDYTIEVINACVPTHSVTSFSPTSGPAGTEFTLTGTGFTASTTVYVGGILATVTFVNSTTLTVEVPALTEGSKTVRVLENGCAVVASSTFNVILNSGACASSNFSDLIISEVYDSDANNVWYIELYNPTSSPIDLGASLYSIERYGTIGDASPTRTIPLTGVVPAQSVFTLWIGDATPHPCNAVTYDFTANGAGINEQDQIKLVKNGVSVDVVNCPNETGYSITRDITSSGPSSTYNAGDWTVSSTETCSDLGVFSVPNNLPNVTVDPVDVIGCTVASANFTVAATASGAGVLTYQWYFNDGVAAGWTAVASGSFPGVTVSGQTTNNLSLTGSVATLNGYQFYCEVIQDGTCTVASDAAQIKTSGTVWNGTTWSNGVPDLTVGATINGNYDTTAHGSFECCSLVVNAGFTVDVQANDYVLIDNDLTVNGTFNVWNDGSLVQINDAGVNTGNISYQRITTGTTLDYVYWAAPVAGVNAPNGYVYNWNPTVANPNGGLGNWVGAGGTAMTTGVGFIMRNVLSRNFTGVPHNGVYAIGIERGSYEGADYAGTNGITITRFEDNWNLIGNPYPSAISAEDFLLANTNIEGAVRLWTHATQPSSAIPNPFYNSFVANYSPSDYITHNGTGTVSGPAGFGGYIGGGQSFMVNMLDGAAASSTITFNNALRSKTYDNSQFYRHANSNGHAVNGTEKNRIWLDIINANNISDRTLVGYITGATEAKDRMYDAVTGVKTAMRLYSIIDADKMTIQGRAVPFSAKDKVQMGYYAPANGTYSIAIAALDGLFEDGQDIYLEDTELNVIHDLRQAPYSFYANSGENNTRFILRYTTNSNTLSVDDVIANENDVLIASAETLNISSTALAIQKVTIHNVLGQLLFNKQVNTTSLQVNGITKSNQTLMVEIVLENNERIVRKVIF